MKTQLNWKKGWLSNTSEIFSESKKIGELKESSWMQSAEGSINQKSYKFKTSGFFKQETIITDTTANKVVGTITYNSWKTEAVIDYAGSKYNWSYKNIWHTSGSIKEAGQTKIDYEHSFTKGKIASEVPSELLILSGLYITSYYTQVSLLLLFALFMPIVIESL